MASWYQSLLGARRRLTAVEVVELLGIGVMALYVVSSDVKSLCQSLVCRLEWSLAGVLGLKLANLSCEAAVREGTPGLVAMALVALYLVIALYLFAGRVRPPSDDAYTASDADVAAAKSTGVNR
jgi:hypothetical protein